MLKFFDLLKPFFDNTITAKPLILDILQLRQLQWFIQGLPKNLLFGFSNVNTAYIVLKLYVAYTRNVFMQELRDSFDTIVSVVNTLEIRDSVRR